MTTENILGAAYWETYFLYGDCSHMDEEEIEAANEWFENNELIDVVGTEGEPFFSWSYGFHADRRFKGGDLIEYVCVTSMEDEIEDTCD